MAKLEINFGFQVPIANLYFQIFHLPGERKSDLHRSAITDEITSYLQGLGSNLSSETIDTRTLERLVREVSLTTAPKFLDKSIRDWDQSGAWAPGECGIWISTCKAFQNFLVQAQNPQCVLLILEDDVWLQIEKDELRRLLVRSLLELPKDWDYLTLYSPEPERGNFSIEHEIGSDNLCLNYTNYCNAALLYSVNGVKKILEKAMLGVSDPVDLFLHQDNSYNAYALKPHLEDVVSVYTYLQDFENSTIRDAEIHYTVAEFS